LEFLTYQETDYPLGIAAHWLCVSFPARYRFYGRTLIEPFSEFRQRQSQDFAHSLYFLAVQFDRCQATRNRDRCTQLTRLWYLDRLFSRFIDAFDSRAIDDGAQAYVGRSVILRERSLMLAVQHANLRRRFALFVVLGHCHLPSSLQIIGYLQIS